MLVYGFEDDAVSFILCLITHLAHISTGGIVGWNASFRVRCTSNYLPIYTRLTLSLSFFFTYQSIKRQCLV